MARNRIRFDGTPAPAPEPTTENPAPAPDEAPAAAAVTTEPEAPTPAPEPSAESEAQAKANAADQAKVDRRNAEWAMVDRALAYWAKATGRNLTRASLLPHMPGDGGPGFRVQHGADDPVRPALVGGRWRLVSGPTPGTEDTDTGGFPDRSKAQAAAKRRNEASASIVQVRIYTNGGTFVFRPAMDQRKIEDRVA